MSFMVILRKHFPRILHLKREFFPEYSQFRLFPFRQKNLDFCKIDPFMDRILNYGHLSYILHLNLVLIFSSPDIKLWSLGASCFLVGIYLTFTRYLTTLLLTGFKLHLKRLHIGYYSFTSCSTLIYPTFRGFRGG